METKMQKMEPTFVARGTHPMMTVLVFAAIITLVVISGTYFSKQRNASRDGEQGITSQISTLFQSAVAQ